MPNTPIATLVRAIQRRPGFDPSLVADDAPTLADLPSKADLRAEARSRFAQALADYERVNQALTAQPIVPGRFFTVGRWVLRGEYDDVPRRYLDMSEKPGAGALVADGSLDDRAEALGFEDGDGLRAWMIEARRPTLKDFERPPQALPYSVADVRFVQSELARESGCRAPSKVREYCSADVAEAVLREALAGRGEARYRRAIQTLAERVRGWRSRLEPGRCTRCARADARPGKTTCAPCNATAAAAVKASRARRKAERAETIDTEALAQVAQAIAENLGLRANP